MCEIINQENEARDINVIAVEIKSLFQQAQSVALSYAIEIGRRLEEAKSVLPHGTWGAWLSVNFAFSHNTANNFMRLFNEYGSNQSTLFGAVPKSQTFANLPYSKALQLLSLSEDEREQFVQDNDVEKMSVRELRQAIEDRDKENEELKKQAQNLNTRISEAERVTEEYKEKARTSEKEALDSILELTDVKNEVKRLEDDLNEANNKCDALTHQLDDSIKNPQISQDAINKIKNEAFQEAEVKFSNEKKNYIAEADNKVNKALDELAAVKKLAEQNNLKNPDIVEFKCVFDQIQALTGKMVDLHKRIYSTDKNIGNKLAEAFKAYVNNVSQRMS